MWLLIAVFLTMLAGMLLLAFCRMGCPPRVETLELRPGDPIAKHPEARVDFKTVLGGPGYTPAPRVPRDARVPLGKASEPVVMEPNKGTPPDVDVHGGFGYTPWRKPKK